MNVKPEIICRKAISLLKKNGVESPAVPVQKLAASEGINVHFVDLEDELSGMALIDGNRIPNIIINANHHPNRQRFSIAHELGHHLLHRELLEGDNVHVDKVILRRDQNSEKGIYQKEKEANMFAAELLMPKFMLKTSHAINIDINDEKSVREIAKLFKVSTTSLSYRLLNYNP